MKTISLDMDGVLADFDTRCVEMIGKRLMDFETSQAGWDALGDLRLDMYKDLPKMKDADYLVRNVIELSYHNGYSVGVLTAVPKLGRVPMAKQHKREWLSMHFPHLLFDFNIGPWAQDKYKHCNPGDVLIDDSKLNIEQWNKAGGYGILHVDAETSIRELKKIILRV